MVPWHALIMPLPANRIPNKIAPNLPNNIPKYPPFCYIASFWIVSLTAFINKQDSSRDLIIFISFISSFEIINLIVPDPSIFSWITASAADAAAVNPNGIKTLLVSGLSAFFIEGDLAFSTGPKCLPKNLPDYPILCN